jgi:hypothetical protein
MLEIEKSVSKNNARNLVERPHNSASLECSAFKILDA